MSDNRNPLTRREIEIVELLADGFSNRDIADHLVITVYTVKDHLKNIYTKLAVSRRTKAVLRARELGLLEPQASVSDTTPKLPVSLLPLIGRDREINALTAHLADPAIRLITLHGPGGIGKTHLALEVARQNAHLFENNVHFINLEALDSGLFLVPALAEALGFRANAPGNLKQELLAYLSAHRALLILDSCEVLLDEMVLIGEILSVAASVKILATSRVRLNIMGELIVNLPGVAYPETTAAANAADYDAVQLFLYNAERVLPGFEPTTAELAAIVQIAQYVEGLPLAILLAATWVNTLSVDEILTELTHDVSALDIEDMKSLFQSSSLLRIFARSWELLSPNQRDIFTRLAIFRGRFTRDAAQAVSGGSLRALNTLVNKSMVQWDPRRKYYYLHSILRQYGLKQLENEGSQHAVMQDYFDYWHDFVHTDSALVQSNMEGCVTEELSAKDTWEPELDDLRASLRWGLDTEQFEQSLKIAMRTRWIWGLYRLDQEAFDWLDTILDNEIDLDPDYHVRALFVTGNKAFHLFDVEKCYRYLNECVAIAQSLPAYKDYWIALIRLGDIALHTGKYEQATVWYEKAIVEAEAEDDVGGRALGLNGLGMIASEHKQQQQALAYYEEGLVYARQSKSQDKISTLLGNLGVAEFTLKHYDEAETYYQEAYEIIQGNPMWASQEAVFLANLSEVVYYKNEYSRARKLCLECIRLAHQVGHKAAIAHELETLAKVETEIGDPQQAAVYYSAAQALREAIGFAVSEREMPAYSAGLDAIRAQLSTAEFEAAWQDGAQTPLDTILAPFLQTSSEAD